MQLDFTSLTTFESFRGISIESIIDDRWGVEGLYSQQFSVGIFFFLIICILFFTIIVIKFMSSSVSVDETGGRKGGLKTGEKVMFFFIFMGILAAVIMAVLQLLQGYLF